MYQVLSCPTSHLVGALRSTTSSAFRSLLLSPFPQTVSSPHFGYYGAAEQLGSQNAQLLSPESGQEAHTLHIPFVPAGSTAAALAIQRPAGFVEEFQPEDLTPRARPIVGTFQDVNCTSEVVSFEEQVEEEEGEYLEGEIQPRGWPIPARPREGGIHIDSDDEECSVTFYQTYCAKRKKSQRIVYTTRQHLRWYKTAPEKFD
jgi:hypothetical protein